MKRFIVECDDESITDDHIIDSLGNEFGFMANVKEIKPVDEEKLDDLALKIYPESNEFDFELSKHMDGWVDKNEGKRNAFKAGYRKAKEE